MKTSFPEIRQPFNIVSLLGLGRARPKGTAVRRRTEPGLTGQFWVRKLSASPKLERRRSIRRMNATDGNRARDHSRAGNSLQPPVGRRLPREAGREHRRERTRSKGAENRETLSTGGRHHTKS
ncbi:hypothetical protein TRVL_08451 [Trypanosoma vivax]|nr:hypothetical protein TRVL_08451 [Trypanosoma vivax]